MLVEGVARAEADFDALIMANHADAKTGRCWASLATLAEASGLSDRGLSKVINRLESGG